MKKRKNDDDLILVYHGTINRPSKTEDQVRIERLESIVAKLCEIAVDVDYSWQSWADPLHSYIKEMKDKKET